MKILNKFNKWFELKLGWIFVNGNKRKEWNDYLKDKYNPTDNDMFQGPTKL